MEEGIGDVELVGRPLPGCDDGEDSANRSWFHHRSECLAKINTGALQITAEYPSCLVSLEGAVGSKLVSKHPLAGDYLDTRWTIH
jgi:hypothetical protein